MIYLEVWSKIQYRLLAWYEKFQFYDYTVIQPLICSADQHFWIYYIHLSELLLLSGEKQQLNIGNWNSSSGRFYSKYSGSICSLVWNWWVKTKQSKNLCAFPSVKLKIHYRGFFFFFSWYIWFHDFDSQVQILMLNHMLNTWKSSEKLALPYSKFWLFMKNIWINEDINWVITGKCIIICLSLSPNMHLLFWNWFPHPR